MLRANYIIRFLYYDCHLADIPVILGSKAFKKDAYTMMNKFLAGDEREDIKILKSLYKDIKKCFYKYKFTPQEYFLFQLRNKTEDERNSYISDRFIMKYAANKSGRRIHDEELNNKYAFYKINKRFFLREVIIFNSGTSIEEFSIYALQVKCIIAKPNEAALGTGVEIFTISSQSDANSVFHYLQTSPCKEYIIEEVIIQSNGMSIWNESSVNTIRINSFLNNGVFNVLCPFIRTGRKGNIVDNGGQGGIFASVDKLSGKIITHGMDEKGNEYTHHPDSHIEYIGWKVPRWQELIKLTETIHRNMPKHVYVSWDFALTDNSWVLIEGNWGEFVCQQMTNNRGFKQDFLTYLNAK